MGEPPSEAERNEYIAELEARLAKPAPLGVTPLVAAGALIVSLGVLFQLREDSAYYFSSRDPVQLGAEGDYRFQLAQHNAYVELHGIPTSRGAFGVDGNMTIVAVGVRDTPVMIWRKAVKGEEWSPGSKPPPPNQQPFTVRGRLLARDQAAEKYSDAFAKLDGFGEVRVKWVLLESVRPGGDFTVDFNTTLLDPYPGIMAWLLARGLLAMRAKSAAR
ncbi:MAG: hypothetical protein JNK82_33955 [Myxococcaceae bacterium]|nr:hypothetical protein [Myxococcaceae bacterium]